MANRLKEIYKDRFDYKKLILDGKNDIAELEEIKKNLLNFIKEK